MESRIATTIEQSKMLAKILPIESADMHYENIDIKGVSYCSHFKLGLSSYEDAVRMNQENIDFFLGGSDYKGVIAWEILPAWSLSKLMDILPQPAIDDDGNEQELVITKEEDGSYWLCYKDIETNNFEDFDASGEDLVDACVEMIEKLHELNLL